MPSRVVVLIGSQDLLDLYRSRPDSNDAELLLFSDQRTREALDAIFDRRPAVLILDKDFAGTPRGVAILGRIKGDPTFSDTQVLVLPESGSLVTPPSWPGPPVDLRGTRRAPRVRVKPGTEMLVDGAATQLVDLSTLGAQVVSPTILKPNQRVRVNLPVAGGARTVAIVAWALFELPKGKPAPQFRAGLEFANPDRGSLEQAIGALALSDDQPVGK
ncbi:MAG: PilZ domain-containing protein [Acidobacteriota bacterium]